MNPEKIKDYVKQQQQEIDQIIPFLNNFSCSGKECENSISIAKGIFAVRESLIELIKNGHELKVYGAPKEAVDTLGLGFLKEFHNERIKKKVLQKHIYNFDAIDRVIQVNKMKLTEARCFSENFHSLASTNICGDNVLLLIFSSPVSAILIKNKEIAQSYHNYFDALWSRAKLITP
jgi:uncharacterized radical SAM superfamily Fe-S cluster-containing enzyme